MIGIPTRLAALNQAQLVSWAAKARAQAAIGSLPEYIPLLAKADPDWFAVKIQRLDGQAFVLGNFNQPFVLMSVVKPFLLLFLLQHLGSDAVFAHVGMEPSDQSFHSIPQLMADEGFPRNPMINSGAIALAGQLPGKTGSERCENLRQWLNQQAGSRLELDEAMLVSVRSLSNETNHALANLLRQAGHFNSVETAIDTYNHICCLSGTVADLAKLGLLLAQPQPQISPVGQRIVNALMLTCGLYEVSGHYAVRIGLPIKSGVSGALLAIVPGEGAIACYGPRLDATGNSVASLFLLEQLAQSLNLSLFSPRSPLMLS